MCTEVASPMTYRLSHEGATLLICRKAQACITCTKYYLSAIKRAARIELTGGTCSLSALKGAVTKDFGLPGKQRAYMSVLMLYDLAGTSLAVVPRLLR